MRDLLGTGRGRSIRTGGYLLVIGACALLGLGLATWWPAGASGPGSTERVSVASDGTEGNNWSSFPSISDDGRYTAFHSAATNLVAGDTNATNDVFVRDELTGITERVSVADDGAQGNDESNSASISADGRYVAFHSFASNLVPGDTNLEPDVFVRDRLSGTTERVSVASGGTQADSNSTQPSITADGRYVAFHSNASNLVSGDTNSTTDVFIHDRLSGTTERVSVASDSTQGNGWSVVNWGSSAISTDGRYVAFYSTASNLVPDDTNLTLDVFVRDRILGTTERASIASDGTEADFDSTKPTISGNGRYIVFYSAATNLVTGDTNSVPDVFVHDLLTNLTERVNLASDGSQSIGASSWYSLSTDGRYVVFDSSAANLVAGDTNSTRDLFLRDRVNGITERMSVATDGAQGNDHSYGATDISANGRYVAFLSEATNLVPGDTNLKPDVFVRDRGGPDGITVTKDAAPDTIAEPGGTVTFSVAVTNDSAVDSVTIDSLTDDVYGTLAGDGDCQVGTVLAPSASCDFTFTGSVTGNAGDTHTNTATVTGTDDNGYAVSDTDDATVTITAASGSAATERVSVDSNEIEGDGASNYPSVSADGRIVAFHSHASNLAPGDTDPFVEVFVRDRLTGTTERVSVASDGTQANGDSDIPSVSADGRYVAFHADGSNLVSGDTNATADVFVRDLLTDTTERVSVASDGSQGDSNSTQPSVSGDGRYVTFTSDSSNLVAGDTNSAPDIFVRDRLVGTTERVSVASDGSEASNGSIQSSVSGDGRYVAFDSDAYNLIPGDTNSQPDVFVRDRLTGTTQRLSVASDGTQASAQSHWPQISADGRFVAFYSPASNLVSGDTNSQPDVFLKDRTDGSIERVSVASDGTQGNALSNWSSVSATGRFIAFRSDASNLVAVDTNSKADVFVRDRLNDTTELVSVASDGSQGDGDTVLASLSADGRYVGIGSHATNLVPDDTNAVSDVFMRDRGAPANAISMTKDAVPDTIAEPGGTVTFSVVVTNDSAVDSVTIDSLTDDVYGTLAGDGDCQVGTVLAPSASCDFTFTGSVTGNAGDTHTDVVTVSGTDDNSAAVSDSDDATVTITAGSGSAATERVSVDSNEVEGDGASDWSSISADGRYAAFTSTATNLVPGDTNSATDAFVRDRVTGTTERVSVASDGTEANSLSQLAEISADGRYVTFQSAASNLVAGDYIVNWDVFVHDRLTGTTERVSVASDGSEADSGSLFPSISADGRYVTFQSVATNLVVGDTNSTWDVFVRDRVGGTTERVSVASDGSEAAGASEHPSVSGDGRFVAYRSSASNLVPGDTNSVIDVFVRDRLADTTERVSMAFDGTQASGASDQPSVSSDGRYAVFHSYATNLVPGDTNLQPDVFVRDRLSGTTDRVSTASDGTQANSASISPSMTGDARYVAFYSSASNLVPGDTNSVSDVFVRDRLNGTTELVSVASDGTQGGADSYAPGPALSADGRYVVFDSLASNLVPDDTNGVMDVFVRDRGGPGGSSGITVTKDADPTSLPEPGGNVTFTVAVTNDSAVDSVTINSLTDDVYGTLAGDGDCQVGTALAPSASCDFTFTGAVWGNAGDTHTDVVTVSGTDDNSAAVSDSDDATVTITDVGPGGVTVTKVAVPDSIAEPGGTASFTVYVENDSAVDSVTIDSLDDDVYGPLTGDGDCQVGTVLAPSASCDFTFTGTVWGDAGSTHTDVVTVSGTDDDGAVVGDDDDATVTITDIGPDGIMVTKDAVPDTIPEPGGTVTFSVVVTNDSAVDSVTIDSLDDDIYGPLTGDGDCQVGTVLAPSASCDFTFTGSVTGNAGSTHTDVVTVSGTDDDGASMSSWDDATVTITDVGPDGITVTKDAVPDTIPEPGGTVTFSVAVTNDSAVDSVTIDSLDDDVYGVLAGDGDCQVGTVLAPSASCDFTFTGAVSSNEAGSTYTDVVTVSGTDDDGGWMSSWDDATVTITDVGPGGITVTKDAVPDTIPEPGGTVTFSVVVTNDSAVDSVTIDSLDDDIYGPLTGDGDCQVGTVLAPSASCDFTFTGSVTGSAGDTHTNTVTVTGTDDDGAAVTNSDDATVTITASAGDVVSILVTGGVSYSNTGSTVAGDVDVILNPNGTLLRVSGVAELPGVSGGTATVRFNVRQFWILPIYTGSVAVSDPGAGISLNTPLFFSKVAHPAPGTATGTNPWATFSSWPWKNYVLTWSVTDTV